MAPSNTPWAWLCMVSGVGSLFLPAGYNMAAAGIAAVCAVLHVRALRKRSDRK